MKATLAMIAAVLVTGTVLFAAVHTFSKYPDRMWMEPSESKDPTFDTRVKFGFGEEMADGTITNRAWGRLGVVRKDGEYVVVWQPLDD